MAIQTYVGAAILAAFFNAVSAVHAALPPVQLTWNPSAAALTDAPTFTFDNIVINSFATLDITGNTFSEQGFLRLSSFTHDGLPVAVPNAGYPSGSAYSLYISYTAAGVQQSAIPGLPVPAFGQFTSLNYSLLGATGITTFRDTNNDGVFEVNGNIPQVIATGTLQSPGSTALTIDPVSGLLLPSAQLTASLMPAPGLASFFVTPNASTPLTVVAASTNTGTVIDQLPLGPNGVRLAFDGGGGNITFALVSLPVPEPQPHALLLAGLGVLAFASRGRTAPRRKPRPTGSLSAATA